MADESDSVEVTSISMVNAFCGTALDDIDLDVTSVSSADEVESSSDDVGLDIGYVYGLTPPLTKITIWHFKQVGGRSWGDALFCESNLYAPGRGRFGGWCGGTHLSPKGPFAPWAPLGPLGLHAPPWAHGAICAPWAPWVA